MGETTFSGSGTEEDPYQLSTDADLIKLKQLVESGNSMSGIYFKMTADITLPKRWTPIGTTIDGSNDIKEGKNLYAFSGIFDGGGKTLTIPKNGYPLLNYVLGAEVRNLNIYGEQINGYGLVNNLSGRGLSGSAVVIDHVTLKKGSSTLKSGLIGAELSTSIYAGCSAGFLTTIRNCTIEEGVVIGYTKEEKQIGAIAGCMQGTVENCVSHAEVYGTNYVGGIIGTRDNALGQVQVSGCTFDGTVTASGEHAGGIVGGGYWHESAPNGNRISITDCISSGVVIGADKVGGVLGGDTYAAQPWANSAVKGNSFTGTVKATSGTYVGGIIGFYDSLNAYDDIANNYYSKDCGAEKGIGFVKYIDTSCETHETASGAVYFSTEKNTDGCPNVPGCWWYQEMNRTDDPMGSDAEKLASNNTEVQKYVKELAVSGEYKKEFYLGDALDLSGIEIKAVYSDGTEKEVSLSEVTVAGYDNMTRGEQTITLSYGGARAEITIKLLAEAGKVVVNFQILGDANHGEDGTIHTLMENTLTSWLPIQTYKIDANATVYDLIKEIEAETEGLEILERYSETYKSAYIYGITFNGITLEELNNGPNSGWMYTVNGVHSQVGVSKEYMNNGDVIILHYTDDYTKEESTLYDQSIADGVTEQIQKIPSVDKLTLQDKAEVEAAREAYDTLTDSQKKMISTATLKLLEAAEARIAELEKNQHVCSWDAGTVTKKATCTETGIMTYKCTCGKTRTEVIEKAAHSYSKWIKVSDATVFAPEVQKHTCSVCKKIQTKNVGSKLKAVLEVPGKLSFISIKKGNTKSLNVTMANGDSVVSVKSSAPKTLKATLDKNGKITLKALKKGSAKLTIKLASKTEKTYKVSVVTGTVKTTKVTVTSVKNNRLTLKKGKTHTLKSELKPFTSTQKVTYKTSDKKVVTVTSSGKIKAVGAGKATITVTSGSKKVKVAVTVPGIANLKSSVTVKKNKTTTLKPKTYGISEKVTYTSSNLKVATVTAVGKVKGVKKGTAKITVQAGTYKYIVTVKVK